MFAAAAVVGDDAAAAVVAVVVVVVVLLFDPDKVVMLVDNYPRLYTVHTKNTLYNYICILYIHNCLYLFCTTSNIHEQCTACELYMYILYNSAIVNIFFKKSFPPISLKNHFSQYVS